MVKEEMLLEVIADFREFNLPEFSQSYHYVIAMLTLMRAVGWVEMDYPTLVVESGVGLSFGYIRNHCVAMYSLQEGAQDRIAAATGCQIEFHVYADLEESWTWVKETIDRGQPVVAEFSEFHVIAGYREGDALEDRAWYVLANEPISDWKGDWLTWEKVQELREACPWSGFGARYGGRVAKEEPAVTLRRVMERLVEWCEHHPGEHKELYKGSIFGLAGIEAYAADLGDLSKTLESDFTFGNNACHAITPQWNARGCISFYLAKNSALYEGAIRDLIVQAAVQYRDAYHSWVEFDELLGQRYVNRDGGKQAVGWADPERRKKASAAVYEALKYEKAAIATLRETLAGMEKTT